MIEPESQNRIDESMKPQWEPPVTVTSCDGPRRFANIGALVEGGTMVSWLPTMMRVAVPMPLHAAVDDGLVLAAEIGTTARMVGSRSAASSAQPPPIE